MRATIVPGVSMWSRWQPDRAMDFNSWYVRGAGGAIVVDPLEPDDAVLAACRDGGVDAVVITNRDHERAASTFAQTFRAPVVASAADAASLGIPVDRTVEDGDECFGWSVIALDGFKTPGEIVLYRRDLRAAISGDAFWGVPAGALRLMPDEKLADPECAVMSARRVRALEIDALLVGDGAPVFRDARAVLGAAIDARDGIATNRINLDELRLIPRAAHPPYGADDAEIGMLLGAERLGYRIVRLPPGNAFAPMHWHTGEEELFIVWDGEPTLHSPRGRFTLRRGDFVAFSASARGAHKVTNDTSSPCSIIMIANTDRGDVCFYPDSRKVAVRSEELLVRSEPALAYFDGE